MRIHMAERIMSGADLENLVREDRAIGAFDRVLLRGYGALEIVRGPVPELTVTTHKRLIDRIGSEVNDGRLVLGFGSWRDRIGQAFDTTLTRKAINYRLTVDHLAGLEIRGLASVRAEGMANDDFTIRARGVADIQVHGLQATRLAVHMAPGGKIVLDGEVQEQQITVRGPGNYAAGGLRSQEARVKIQGPGQAAVWAEERLKVTIQGPGQVTYLGAPAVEKRIFGPAVVRRMGGMQEVV